jgi:ABC-type hemin transport system substrate-binding protein
MPRRRYGKPVSLLQLQAILSQAIIDTKRLTDIAEPTPELVLKVSHALAQLAGPYRQLLETSDLQATQAAMEHRLVALEDAHHAVNGQRA